MRVTISGTGRAIGAMRLALAAALALPALASAETQPVPARYLWNLSTETGPIQTSGFQLAFDQAAREIVVTGENVVRIFNPSGMEDFSFPAPPDAGRLLSAAALGESGDIALLAVADGGWSLRRLSFRGEPEGVIAPRGVPEDFLARFGPNSVRVRGGRIYLVDLSGMRVLVLEQDGALVRAVDVAQLLGFSDKERTDSGMTGFGVDVDGGILFTIATRFRAYALSPAGELREWGKAGGAPGLFNIAAGIASDEHRFYVVDALKCAVIVFDRDLRFVEEFGYRRAAPGGLVNPSAIEAGNGLVYVSQNARRGVSVYAVAE